MNSGVRELSAGLQRISAKEALTVDHEWAWVIKQTFEDDHVRYYRTPTLYDLKLSELFTLDRLTKSIEIY